MTERVHEPQHGLDQAVPDLLVDVADTLPEQLGGHYLYDGRYGYYCALGWLAHLIGIPDTLLDRESSVNAVSDLLHDSSDLRLVEWAQYWDSDGKDPIIAAICNEWALDPGDIEDLVDLNDTVDDSIRVEEVRDRLLDLHHREAEATE